MAGGDNDIYFNELIWCFVLSDIQYWSIVLVAYAFEIISYFFINNFFLYYLQELKDEIAEVSNEMETIEVSDER